MLISLLSKEMYQRKATLEKPSARFRSVSPRDHLPVGFELVFMQWITRLCHCERSKKI